MNSVLMRACSLTTNNRSLTTDNSPLTTDAMLGITRGQAYDAVKRRNAMPLNRVARCLLTAVLLLAGRSLMAAGRD